MAMLIWKTFLISLISLLAACSTTRCDQPAAVERSLNEYVQDFGQVFGREFKGPVTYYNGGADKKVGYFRTDNCGGSIWVNTHYYDKLATERHKRFLMYHELAHAMGVDHDNTKLPDGCQASIMHPTFFSNNGCIDQHFEHYIEDLRSRL